jgi:DNA-binding PadR family transcriptional regulator
MALREVILTVLTRGKMTGYEITRDFDQVLAHFWRASHQQVYRELARLDEDGFVTHEVVPQPGKPDKKVYGITRSGREELKRWVGAPTEPPRLQSDILVKLLASHAVDDKVFRLEIERLQGEAEGLLKRYLGMRKQCFAAAQKPDAEYERVMDLALRRGLLLFQAQVQWLEEVRAYLTDGSLKK